MAKHDSNRLSPSVSFAAAPGARLPRYTSYPTALNFEPLDADTYATWLQALPEGEAISLYIHVPFCQQLCWFCGCHTHVTSRYRPITSYLVSLFKELQLLAWHLPTRISVAHIHFGGGSPTLLSALDFEKLMGEIRGLFAVRQGAEIAIEIDPRTLDKEKIEIFSTMGVNRASLGVQDFDPGVQKAINRVQPYELVRDKVNELRRAGIRALNMDLICGLPFQTATTIAETANKVLELAPDRIALFSYAHVPAVKKHQNLIPLEALPEASEKRELRQIMEEIFLGAGYHPLGLDHFARAGDALALAARQGKLHRNFQGYTLDPCRTLIGIGPSAISKTVEGYAQNTTDLKAWRNLILGGYLPVNRGRILAPRDRVVGAAIERLMCELEVDLASITQQFEIEDDFFDYALDALQAMRNEGIIAFGGKNIRVISEDRNAVRSVAACLDQYFPA